VGGGSKWSQQPQESPVIYTSGAGFRALSMPLLLSSRSDSDEGKPVIRDPLGSDAGKIQCERRGRHPGLVVGARANSWAAQGGGLNGPSGIRAQKVFSLFILFVSFILFSMFKTSIQI
jgi:hypothetical protein